MCAIRKASPIVPAPPANAGGFERSEPGLEPWTTANILTVAEVARQLRVSKAHVHHLIAGKVQGVRPLPALRIGRRVLIRLEALRLWVIRLEGRDSEILPRPADHESVAGA